MAMTVSNCRWQAPFLSPLASTPSTSTSSNHLELPFTAIGRQSRGVRFARSSGSGSSERRQQWRISAELSAGQAVDLSDPTSALEPATISEVAVETRLTILHLLTLLNFWILGFYNFCKSCFRMSHGSNHVQDSNTIERNWGGLNSWLRNWQLG